MSDTRTVIESLIREISGETEIDHSLDLFDSGMLTSVDSLDLLSGIESTFSISIPDEELTVENFGTIDSLAKLIDRVMNRAVE